MIPPPRDAKTLVKEHYGTKDIMSLVQKVARSYVADTAKFAERFPPTRAGLKALFNWVHKHFRYKEDPRGSQWVQTPAWLNRYKVGDCKSFSAFISTVLTNMGIDHKIRYAAYAPGDFRHVYVVAILDEEEIPMDVVWKIQEGGKFGSEKWPQRTKDYFMKGLAQLGNSISGKDYIGKMETQLSDIRRASANIPDTIGKGWGDVTKLTKGELDRMIFEDRFKIQARRTVGPRAQKFRDAARAMRAGSIAGLGAITDDAIGREVSAILRSTARKTQPAFRPLSIVIPALPQPTEVNGFFDGIIDKAKNIVKNVKGAIGKLFKKFVNWMFKGAAKRIGPFFIFQFLKKNRIKSKRIKDRIKEQDRTYGFIQRVGKFDDSQLKGVMLNGILEDTGMSPKQMAIEAGAPKVGALPAIPVIMKAVGWVVSVVEKIAGIFKKNKNEGGLISEATMSDPTLLEEEARLQAASGYSPGAITEGGNNSLLLAASVGIPLAIKFLI